MNNRSKALLHTVVACVGLATVISVLVLLLNLVWRMKTHQEWSRRVRADIYALASKRPNDIPPGQWEFVVGWTVNLHANCGADFTQVDASKREPFAVEFERKLRGPVDMSTIDWLWDQYERMTQSGKFYSDKYRPTKSDDLKDAEESCFGIAVK